MNKITQITFAHLKGTILVLALLLSSGTVLSKSFIKKDFTNRYSTNGHLEKKTSVLTTAIVDPIFEQALIDFGLDNAIDGKVLTDNIDSILELDVSGLGISDLTGIQDFISLKVLKCENNDLTDLNLSGLTSMQDLYCAQNTLSSLDVSMLPNLRYLDCQDNTISDLNVTGLTNLNTLIVWFNQLTTIDLSTNINLDYLDCDDNHFTSIDVSALKKLNQFYCSGNDLSDLSVRGLTNLVNFECTDNALLTCILVGDVTSANTASTTIDPSQSPNTFWNKESFASYSYCDCSLISTWTSGGWVPAAPTSATAAIIAYDYNVSADIHACTLTINNNANVVIPSGYNVTLNSPLTVESGSSFTLSNNANLVQSSYAANSGAITVNRNGNALYRLDYTMWSSPVSGAQTLGDFSPLSSANPSRFYSYEADGYVAVSLPYSTVFGAGKGYLIRMPNEKPGSLGTNTQYYLVNETLEYKGVFTGTPNNGNVSLTGLTPEKFYSVGNPYPSTISAEAFLDNSNNNTGNVLYFWRKKNSDTGSSYATYTKGGGTVTEPGITAPNGTIQVGQGFIVKTGVGASALNFTNAMRTSDNQNQFFRTKKAVEKNRVWLNLTSKTGVFSQALVGYMTDATQDVDAGIDGKYINDSKIALTSNINNEEYTIQGRSLPFDPSDVVPLNFKTDKAGDYTIAIDHTDGLFATGQDVYLVDSETGTETDLKAGSYTFTAPAGTANARFSLKYQKTLAVDAPAFNENGVTVYKNKAGLYVNSGVVTIANVKVYDIQGKLLVELKDVNATSATISSLKDTQQVLVVKITSEDNTTVVTKKVVN